MFWPKKRKSIFATKRYKIERHRVRYQNPLRKKKWLFQFKFFKLINLILLIGILGCLYFFIFSDFYNITNIEINGNQIISSDDVLDITNNFLTKNNFLILKNKNIFLFNRNSLKKKIGEVVLLDNIKIEKILPNTIRITIKEKSVALKFVSNSQEYLVDNQGVVIKIFYKIITPKIFQLTEPIAIEANNDQNLLKINNLAAEDANLGDKILNTDNITFITNLTAQLKEKDYLTPKDVLIPNKLPQYLVISLNSGAQIYFNFSDSIENQLSRLNLIIDQKIKKNNLNGVEYIDLRLGESVYYKMK